MRQLDLADLLSVQQLGAALAQEKRLDLLFLNAGVMVRLSAAHFDVCAALTLLAQSWTFVSFQRGAGAPDTRQ